MPYLIAAAWIAFGAAALVVLYRRGHDVFGWAILFLFLGPLAIPVAVTADRHPPPEPDRPAHRGELDVLVVHDGSAQADAALHSALAILGSQMTSLTLAAVVDVEARTTAGGRNTLRDVQDCLDEAIRCLSPLTRVPVYAVVLHGEPAHTLDTFAAEHGYELIVAGNGSRGASHAQRAVVRRLATVSSVPVLLGPSA